MSFDLRELPWLPRSPADLRQQIKAVDLGSEGVGATIQRFATHALDSSQATLLAKVIRASQASGVSLAPLSSFRLGLLASSTYDLVVDELVVAAARHGVALEVVSAPYDQVVQQAMDPGSAMNAGNLDAVLLAVDYRWLALDEPEFAAEGATQRVAAACERLNGVVEALTAHGGNPVILPTLAPPPGAVLGSFDRMSPGSIRRMIGTVNSHILSLAQQHRGYVLDLAGLVEDIGGANWFDPVQWNLYKLPFAATCVPLFADHVGRLIGAMRGKAKKCLVLDLDNTTWGGVIGDDGLEGIRIGQGSADGEAHLAVQKLALTFRSRGVVLAVCSKNDEDNARKPFREHPDMLLKETDIAVFQANWVDKATNLEAIAKALNIGVDSLVLLDDNPAERAQVRAALPMVGVPEIGADASYYPFLLSSAGYFEAVSLSEEDRIRAKAYAEDAQRVQVMKQARSLGDYLTALEMVISFAPFDPIGRPRIAQLINKSNQFNLTSRRYTEVEVEEAEKDPAVFTLQVRLRDRFGDAGMIGVIIARPLADNPRAWEIDSWLMSCRVLGRKVEEAMLTALVRAARACDIETIFGLYIPTAKNGMVAEHYPRLGFMPCAGSDGRFSLDVATFAEPELPMRVEEHSELSGKAA